MRILVTAGSTWAKVDKVRILTNRFTGGTGLYLANKLVKKGHKVTLVINPHSVGKVAGINSVYFHYFDQFKKKITDLLKSNKFDAVIHAAAVNDYLPKIKKRGKIPSGKKDLNIFLVPAPKIIKTIRRLAKDSVLIQFKLEVKKRGIIDKAYHSLKENGSDYVVANALEDLKTGYKAILIDRNKNLTKINSKSTLTEKINQLPLRGR
ncbi:MAG: phosphopantothenoylcysteine decarboxylase [Candidatus Omnitrophota bacterium]